MCAKKSGKEQSKSGKYAYDGLDRTMHEKARLSILTSLASRPEGLLFGDLKKFCSLTDGNLSRHLQTLQDAGLVEVWKGFQGRRPQTLCRLSQQGRERFLDYLGELERVIRDAASVKKNAGKAPDEDDMLSEGWVSA